LRTLKTDEIDSKEEKKSRKDLEDSAEGQ
jgi:hypothetical protein